MPRNGALSRPQFAAAGIFEAHCKVHTVQKPLPGVAGILAVTISSRAVTR